MRSLAEILKTALLKLHTGLDNPDFNLTIDDVPRGEEDKEYFRWHMRILPRLSTPAGFELGSGMSINTVLPEDAAAFLARCRSPAKAIARQRNQPAKIDRTGKNTGHLRPRRKLAFKNAIRHNDLPSNRHEQK